MDKIRYIRKEGRTKVISIGKLLPDDWRVIVLEKIKQTGESVTIKINKVA